ncbi:hypothetical protein CORC01_14041 [Colletotrichum orchidophilum]|uniref:Uncharacterized protein n=1 Tax=Colletotrichum orchidophilum TaxID=1209926 RepID=A0A1G4ANN0_9PEZI|nr:uncharacterized protein CORC01_14041 [Colletotrichum orchidophilum]OHE90653.1 hypothetical protein CORC01_14041 [Colletotrichum orchidophilum]
MVRLTDKAHTHAHTHVGVQHPPPHHAPFPLVHPLTPAASSAYRLWLWRCCCRCSLSLLLLVALPYEVSRVQEKHPSTPWALVPCLLWGFTIWRRLIRVVHRVPSANSKQATTVEPMCPGLQDVVVVSVSAPRSLDSHDTKTTAITY